MSEQEKSLYNLVKDFIHAVKLDRHEWEDWPDDSREAFEKMQDKAIEGFGNVQLLTPFIKYSKSDIVKEGQTAGTPFNKTWSCYKGGDVHCGTCGTCVERKEAFQLAGIQDPTIYLR